MIIASNNMDYRGAHKTNMGIHGVLEGILGLNRFWWKLMILKKAI